MYIPLLCHRCRCRHVMIEPTVQNITPAGFSAIPCTECASRPPLMQRGAQAITPPSPWPPKWKIWLLLVLAEVVVVGALTWAYGWHL